MRTIIAGSRSINDYNLLLEAIEDSGFEISTVISGGARGVDKLGEKYAKEHNLPLEIYEADWDKYGKSAGYKRNEIMAKKGNQLLALWDGNSNGTRHMINLANKYRLEVYIHEL